MQKYVFVIIYSGIPWIALFFVVESGFVSYKKYERLAAHVQKNFINNSMNTSIILQNNINALSIIHYNVKYKRTVCFKP